MPDDKTSTELRNDNKVPDFKIFKEAKDTIKKLVNVMDEQEQVVINNRHLRYTEIDIEAERKAGRLAPDELYVPQHLIDTNIRREQAVYVSYITQSSRAVILTNLDDPSQDTQRLERDFTNKVRYEGWQVPLLRTVDGMQQDGYHIVELVHDQTKPGHMALQEVSYGDFGYSLDSRDLQSCEMVVRRYKFTKSQLLALAREDTWKFDKDEVNKVVSAKQSETNDYKEQSLYSIEKVMFRKGGVVHVGWSCQLRCNDWLRAPRPLFIGRMTQDVVTGKWTKAFETSYPYNLVPYTITENTQIRQHKGRSYLDQDFQEGISSLMSSFITAHRRASYFMFSKESEMDPNADVVTQSNIIPKSGAVINSKVKQFQLTAPESTMLSAIQALATANAQENSQINYAADNRQDSRKTATEIQAASRNSQQLSTIQLALFSNSLKSIYYTFWEICRSRILAKLIVVSDELYVMYSGNYSLKPAGDVDVVERQQKIQAMLASWPVVGQTAAAPIFLSKLLTLMFPDDAPQYNSVLQEDQKKNIALQSCLQVLGALVQDPNALSPHEKANLPMIQQLMQQITMILQPQQKPQQQGQQNASSQPKPAAAGSDQM